MATTLQRQLAALATPSSAVLIPERRRNSILFTSQEAAGFSRDTFYQIGLEGLYELIETNHNLFRKFRDSIIFDDTSKNLERAVAEKTTNDEIDETVEKFLISVSPYLMLKSSLKCLEWLVYRFHIEKFNVDSILKCIMPYYDTKTFVLIVQILELGKFRSNKEWYWLTPNVKTAMPLSKATLYSNTNAQFIGWLFETLRSYLQVHLQQENLRVFISFMTSTMVGVLNSVNENLMKKTTKKRNTVAVIHRIWGDVADLLLQIKQLGRKSSFSNEVHCMVYVVCTQLVLVIKQEPNSAKGLEDVIGKVMRYIMKTHPRSLRTQAYLVMNSLAGISKKSFNFKNRVVLNRVLTELTILSSDWDLWDLLLKVILHPLELEEFLKSPKRIWNHLNKIELSIPQRSEILRSLYNTLCSTPGRKKMCRNFLERFEREYPTEFALASKSDGKFADDLSKLSKGKDIYLLAQHPEIKTRKQAVLKLLSRFVKKYIPKPQQSKIHTKKTPKSLRKKEPKNVKKLRVCIPDENPTAQVLIRMFLGDSKALVLVLVKQKLGVLRKLFSLEKLVELLIYTMQREHSDRCTKLTLEKLLKVASKIPEENSVLISRIFATLTPYLFPIQGRNTVDFALKILTNKFAQSKDFFLQYSSALDLKDTNAQKLFEVSYDTFLNKVLPFELWSYNLNATHATFACLALNTENTFESLMTTAESLECELSCGGDIITKCNFAKCVQLAQSKNVLSLELLCQTISSVRLTEVSSISRVLKFMLRCSLRMENRSICAKFLHQYMEASFPSAESQLHFWCFMIRSCANLNENTSDNSVELEFYMIRSLQLLISFLESSGQSFQANMSIGKLPDAESGADIIELVLTQCLLHGSYRVRASGINCIQAMTKTSGIDGNVCSFLTHILTYSDEILADREQISVVISEIFREKKFPTVLERFLSIILNTEDSKLVTSLLQLFKSSSSEVFVRLQPLVRNLLTTNPESEVLLAILDCFDGSLEGTLDVISACMKSRSSCSKILSKITAEVAESYTLPLKKKLFANLIDSILHCDTPDIKVAVQRCVRKWNLEGSMVAAELEKCAVMEKLQTTSGSANSSGPRKKTKGVTPSKKPSKSCFGDIHWTDRAEVILEFLQSEKKLKQKTKLILPLFKLLKICIALEEQSPVEYLKQLILTSMTLCCYKDEKAETQDSNDWIHFNVETIIDCLRCSRNPQTHHHALILLNYAARLYPEQVLHGIMSLFTFMGSSILRQDDAYSTQLIQQTVTTIIPTLANTGAVGRFSKGLVSAGIFRVFTSAVQDIPTHRRLPVFTSLVETLDPKESMWQVCIIILDNALTRDKKRSNLNADIDLAADLAWNFDPEVVLLTIERIYSYFTDLQIYECVNNDNFRSTANRQTGLSKAVIDLSRKESIRDVEIVILFTLELVSKICNKFADLEGRKLTYDFLLEKCLSYSRTVSRIREDKIFRLITQRNFEIIGKVNAVLEPKDFVRVTKSILDRDDLNVKKKMLDMLNHRILQKAEWFRDLEVLLELLHPLVQLGSCTPDTEEMVTIVQLAFLSLKLIARQLAATHPEEFVIVFELCLSHCSNKNRLLGASALLCMSELFCLKSLILANLEVMCSIILKAFKASVKLNSEGVQELMAAEDEADKTPGTTSVTTANLLCISTMTCVNKLTDQMGSFLGAKFLQRVLVKVLTMEGTFGMGEKASNRKKVFDLKLKVFMKTVSTKIPLRNSLPSFLKVFKDLVKNEGKQTFGIVLLMNTLRDTLQNSTEKADFTMLLPTLCDAFLEEFLTFRESVVEAESSENDNAETAIIECLISGMVLKMSEGIFRPFYHRLLDWASDSIPRLITFYRVSAFAAERLKSLFVTFAGYVIAHTAEMLQKDSTLTEAILKFLFQLFSNDREGFITMDRFNSLVKPILELVESDYVLSGAISMKMVNDVLIQLAAATSDLNRWQYLVELLGMKSQHRNKDVRLYVLSTLDAAIGELGKDFLALLPPSVPFLSELLTDDAREVEDETKRILIRLEDALGEPLEPYFTS